MIMLQQNSKIAAVLPKEFPGHGTLDWNIQNRYSIVGTVGNTPLLRMRKLAPINDSVQIYAKAEWFNPGGSVKDRAALNMLLEAERSGRLTREKIIIDATSGNTGIAYAMIGSAMGYRVTLAIPSNVNNERRQMLLAFGSEIIFTH